MFNTSDCEDEIDESDEKFNSAATYLAGKVDEIDQKALLELYGLYKQSTAGKCNIPKPGMFSLQKKAKWNAWNDLGEMQSQEAKQLYTDKICELFPDFNPSKKLPKSQQWVSVSSHIKADDNNKLSDEDKTIFDFLKESNYEKLELLLNQENINQLDSSGLGLIHWASDRGDTRNLKLLLQKKADVNLRDTDGQTALHYASSCGNLECIHILLQFNADKTILDNENSSCIDVAFDTNIVNALIK